MDKQTPLLRKLNTHLEFALLVLKTFHYLEFPSTVLCFHAFSCNKSAPIREATGRTPRVNHASSESPETAGGPVRPLGSLLASSLPNYNTHLSSPSDDSTQPGLEAPRHRRATAGAASCTSAPRRVRRSNDVVFVREGRRSPHNAPIHTMQASH